MRLKDDDWECKANLSYSSRNKRRKEKKKKNSSVIRIQCR
jgi:hypothetical protein